MKDRMHPYYPSTNVSVTYKGIDPPPDFSFEYRPFAGYESLSVITDVKTGDRETVNPHEFRKLGSQDYIGEYFRDSYTETYQQTGYVAPFIYDEDGIPNWDILWNSALADLYEQLRSGDAGSGLNLAVDAAESRQVLKMVKDATKLVNFVRSFHPKKWGDRWLEYQYGWKPLVSSVYGTADAILNRRLYSYQRIVGKGREGEDSVRIRKGFVGEGATEYISKRYRSRLMVSAEFETPNDTRQQIAGYTSLNPAVIAWELVPYSFIVDWFIDIGGYLQTMESALAYGQAFKGGFTVRGYKLLQSSTVRWAQAMPGLNEFGSGEAYFRQSYKQRGGLGAFPIPVLPSFKVDLGSSRLLSAASLLSQHLRR